MKKYAKIRISFLFQFIYFINFHKFSFFEIKQYNKIKKKIQITFTKKPNKMVNLKLLHHTH